MPWRATAGVAVTTNFFPGGSASRARDNLGPIMASWASCREHQVDAPQGHDTFTPRWPVIQVVDPARLPDVSDSEPAAFLIAEPAGIGPSQLPATGRLGQ